MTTAPSASGTLADTPLAHGLVYARNRRLSGRLELTIDDRRAVIALWRGRITSVTTSPLGMCPGGYLGAVVYELGFIDSLMLDVTLLEIAKTKRLHGEVLLERNAITEAQRDEALVEQVHRKIQHLFSLPDTTSYAFFDADDDKTTKPPVAVDPVGPVWRGIRDYPPLKFVAKTVALVNDNALRLTPDGSPRLPPAETALVELLAKSPMTLVEMKTKTELPPARVDLLVYLLVISKCVEAVSGARTHPSTGQLPVSMPSGPMPAARTSSPYPHRLISSTKIPAVRISAAPPGLAAPAGSLAALKSPAECGMDAVIARAQTIAEESLFQVLGSVEGASVEAVRAAYMRLVKTWHPDRLPPELAIIHDEVSKIFARMNEAHQTLTDPFKRREYELSRKTAAAAAARPRSETLRSIKSAMHHRDFETAIVLTQELIDADADDAEALALHTWASVHGGEATEDELRAALAKMEKAVNLDRTNEEAVFHRGLVHKRLNNVPAAFRDFARAVQLNPKHLEAEREVRIFAMRARKGSGEHKLVGVVLDKLGKK